MFDVLKQSVFTSIGLASGNEALQRIGVARTEDVESLTQRLELLEQKVNG